MLTLQAQPDDFELFFCQRLGDQAAVGLLASRRVRAEGNKNRGQSRLAR